MQILEIYKIVYYFSCMQKNNKLRFSQLPLAIFAKENIQCYTGKEEIWKMNLKEVEEIF